MKELILSVTSVKKITDEVYLLGLSAPYIARRAVPGQFLHIKVNHTRTILRRPFSIHEVKGSVVYVLFRIRGRGTQLLARVRKGDSLNVIGPLGKGFDYRLKPPQASLASNAGGTQDPRPKTRRNELNILVAGGMGVAPLVFLAEKLRKNSPQAKNRHLVLLGAKHKKEIVGSNEFKRLGFKTHVATEDGSGGFKGTVTELLAHLLSTRYETSPVAKRRGGLLATYIYACGPAEMFFEIAQVIRKYPSITCQVSFEQFMGCGIGVCCGCAISTKTGYKKVCKDGPVFDIREIW